MQQSTETEPRAMNDLERVWLERVDRTIELLKEQIRQLIQQTTHPREHSDNE
jgi:hypothetical protein